MTATRRTVNLGTLTRVEGAGALRVTMDGDHVERVELNIYEPPRFFEAFLRGRAFTELPDLTARVCGICPVAYQVSACNAVEDGLGVVVDDSIRALRRLLYCGEWIASHALHIYLLHAPDFLGYPDAFALAGRSPQHFERGMALKKAGNAVLELLGGRAVHPVNVRVGGFYALPDRHALQQLAEQLRRAHEDAIDTVHWVAGFDYHDMEIPHPFLATLDTERYAIETGVVHTSAGQAFAARQFGEHITETQVPHSTALQAALDGARYLTGPLARYSLNSEQLSPSVRELAHQSGLGAVCRNPFRSIVIRAVEVVYAVEEALRIIDEYVVPARSHVDITPRAGVGYGVSEAPRGLLYHRYEFDSRGDVVAADLVPPTSQNQSAIEHDVAWLVAANPGADDHALAMLCERLIRCYDPCISCAAHFLNLKVDRR